MESDYLMVTSFVWGDENLETHSVDVSKIKEYCEQLCANKFYNLDELDNFLKETDYNNSFKKK